MSAPVRIVGVDGQSARVTEFGQLVTSPVSYSTPVNNKLDVIDTAFSFISPSAGQQIVITGLVVNSNRNVGVNDATIDIYGADSPTSTTILTSILQFQGVKQTTSNLIGLNLLISQGEWVNAKTDDNDIFITIMYYRVPVED